MRNLFIVFLCILSLHALAQKKEINRPKLVIGIVADQMRWDYLYRFQSQYGKGGFNRLLNKGFSFENVMINYSPSVTAIGHATIYTGSVPAIHGVTGNTWVDVATGKRVYCVGDSTASAVGIQAEKEILASEEGEVSGQMSPANLLTTTVTDELRLATNFRSKVIGVSLKDRAAIIPAGHTANIAYWFDDVSGKFISSTYYAKELPVWANEFNNAKIPDQLVANGWNTLRPIESYKQSSADFVPWEGRFIKEKKSEFPHDLSLAYNASKGTIRSTPFGNTLTLEFAKRALEGHDLGMGLETDFLTINLASTDYVGHMYGPNSVEIEDVYARLDKDLEVFFDYLDKKIGKNNYLIFLTADHGGAHVPAFLEENKIPAGNLNNNVLRKAVNIELSKQFGEKELVSSILNHRIHFNWSKIKDFNQYNQIKRAVISQLEQIKGVQMVVDMENIGARAVPEPLKTMLVNGFNKQRSGPLVIVPEPGWITGRKVGTTHGVWNAYDTHIPLVFMGWKIKPGKSNQVHGMTDIAPTLAALLKIQMPNGCVGKPLIEVLP
jgi:hypothetical protein